MDTDADGVISRDEFLNFTTNIFIQVMINCVVQFSMVHLINVTIQNQELGNLELSMTANEAR